VFLDNSRYARVAQDTVTTKGGRSVTAIRLRSLTPTAGDPCTVLERDRLDLLAHDRYADDTRFWHIADANSELDARELTRTAGAVIIVPQT
jgi:hypothetical protein